MPEEPEDVLVQHRVAALRRDEEVGARLTIEEQHRQARRERRQDGDEQDRVRLDRPDE